MKFGQDNEEATSPLWSHASRVPIFNKAKPAPRQTINSLIEQLMDELPDHMEEPPARNEAGGENQSSYREVLETRRTRFVRQIALIKRLMKFCNKPELHVLKKMYTLGLQLTEVDLEFC